jgi:AraC-like DNA-binding protein
METTLTERLRRSPTLHPATSLALQMFGSKGLGATVRNAASEAGVCKRHFIRLFSAQVGLTPKLFCRVLRFQHARVLTEQDARVLPDPAERTPCAIDWAALATTCGYFDQSHLINDFNEFSGSSPTQYVRLRQPDPRLKDNHVPLPH